MIDYSDIPDSTAEELKAMRRVGRPPLGAEARQLIAIRVDREVLAALRREARRQKVGYQTLVHKVLARYARRVA
ncbi:MAG: BrnA antitoxin family protein [Terriglobales bacterium]